MATSKTAAPARRRRRYGIFTRIKRTFKRIFSEMFPPNPGPLPATLLFNLGIILVFGMLMLFSASYTTGYLRKGDSYYYIKDQLFFVGVGLAVMLVASRIDYHWVRRWTHIGYPFSLILLGVVLTCEPINGCRRWLHWNVGLLKRLPSIQVSEIVKFEMILLTAHCICKYRSKRRPLQQIGYGIFMPLIPLLPVLFLLYKEPHLSGMVIMCAIVGTIMLLGGSGGVWLWLFGLAGIALVVTAYRLLPEFFTQLTSYVADRLDGWTSDVAQMTDQTRNSLYAIGSGGTFGVGLGNSLEKQLWLPECVNDFIFSVICEELGFVGALVVVVLFVVFIGQCLYISLEAADLYGRLVGLGITAQIGWQVFFNIGVVTNTLPNTGISLPFFSSGGTSLLMLLGEMGVLLSIARAGTKAKLEAAAQAAAAQNEPPPANAPAPGTPVRRAPV